jgi:hypothetical protein
MLDFSQQVAPAIAAIVRDKHHGGYIPAYCSAGSIDMTATAFHVNERREMNAVVSVAEK